MLPSEYQIQSAFIDETGVKGMQDERWKLIHSTPNAGKRSFAAANRMKREGMRKGFPDITVEYAAHGYRALFLEFKAVRGRISEEQVWWLRLLKKFGSAVFVVRSAEAAVKLVEDYFDPESGFRAKYGDPQSGDLSKTSQSPEPGSNKTAA